MTMAEKRKKLTNREWWEQHREQFERTERHYRELMAELEAKIAAKRGARERTSS